ncbi:MAG: SatD family protein [Actinomycetota bacterium]|nr:SatD family protein [Actinomycetota bacterium]
MFVLTLDQQQSRDRQDAVGALLTRLNARERDGGILRDFERTAGDEAQGIVGAPETLLDIVLTLVREQCWHIGVGIGSVDEPLPASTRAGRGVAFVRARTAVGRAKSAPHRLSVVGVDDYRAEHVETVLWLLAAVVARRSARGWEVADMLAQGMTRGRIADVLGISASAVSQRLQVAGVVEEQRGRALALALLAEADR